VYRHSLGSDKGLSERRNFINLCTFSSLVNACGNGHAKITLFMPTNIHAQVGYNGCKFDGNF
jgi:hypothetical protein